MQLLTEKSSLAGVSRLHIITRNVSSDRYLGDLEVDGAIILKWVLMK
jgi:hypothetical protein